MQTIVYITMKQLRCIFDYYQGIVLLSTIKFLNFGTLENFAVIFVKFKQRGQTLRVFCQCGANGIANSEDPNQTAPLGAV